MLVTWLKKYEISWQQLIIYATQNAFAKNKLPIINTKIKEKLTQTFDEVHVAYPENFLDNTFKSSFYNDAHLCSRVK